MNHKDEIYLLFCLNLMCSVTKINKGSIIKERALTKYQV